MSWQRGSDDIPANDPVMSTMRSGFTAIEELCRDLLPVCDEEGRKEIVEKLDSRMKNLIKSELLYQENPKIVNTAIEKNPIPDEASDKDIFGTLQKIEQACLKQVKKYEKDQLTDDVITSNPRYVQYKQVLGEVLPEEGNSQDVGEEDDMDNDEDTDVEMDEDEDVASVGGDIIPTVDPLTRKALKDPVRNINCGHIYGKQSMLELIKQNQRTRCPTAGCQNPDFIRPTHLKSDPQLTRRVAMKLKQQKNQR